MKIKPIGTFLSETPWKVGQKVKVISVEKDCSIYVKGKVYSLVKEFNSNKTCIEGDWNGYSAELALVEENSQFEFDFEPL